MAVTYATPGVYVEQVDKGTKPIEAAGVSITAFIGITREASLKSQDEEGNEQKESVLGKAQLVSNWTQYTSIFGWFADECYLPDAVYGYFNNGGGPCYVTSIRALDEMPVRRTKTTKSSKSKDDKAKETDEKQEDNQSEPVSDVVGDPISAKVYIGDAADRTGINGLEAQRNVSLLVCPDIFYGYDGSPAAKTRVKQIQTAMIAHCENMQYRFALLDTPPGLNTQQAEEWRYYVNFDTSYAALYYPWVEIADFSDSPQRSKMVPPSGHVVGIYNRTDAARGVHKAPANEVILGAIDVEIDLTKGEQDTLNPIGVNCIRTFPGRGIRVWGGRTLSSDGSWRYINVRRLFNQVGESLDTGLQWVVFEPNDRTLWARVRRDITAFLKVVWRSGALFGATPDAAFYVKCDDELNPPEIRDLGQLIIEVGLAPVKPAEFVILRLSQWVGADAETS